ncbi:MAG TPA: glycosyltransferase family 1 protein [Flavitalea sp.]|nr:glycosyltransferase family 1 protein [Flavitalea sp.]
MTKITSSSFHVNTEATIISDLVCFSHLRWNFVFQRPQHLLSRFAKVYRLFYVEEPIFHDHDDTIIITLTKENVFVVVPHLKNGMQDVSVEKRQETLLQQLFNTLGLHNYMFWYYTPMALAFTSSFNPEVVVYDCMDELSAFKFAPPSLKRFEADLLQKADVVFTGGQSLYEAKKDSHHNIHPFPSSIDKEHFSKGRQKTSEPADQLKIPHPRIGFYGVVDERMDIELIGEVARQRPKWHFVIIGPVVKIDPSTLPKYSNIHYLGGKTYNELPSYLGGWDIAIIPFALNESTRFISPTKTPEYLSAGKPVISTSIRDVVHPYGTNELVHIADSPAEFIEAAEKEISKSDRSTWLSKVDVFLSDVSWDNTWKKMMNLIDEKVKEKQSYKLSKTKEKQYV